MIRALMCALFLTLAFPGAAHAGTLKVVTYNLGLLNVLGSDYVPMVEARARAAPGELARFATAESPDIILLEEVWQDRDARAIQDALAPLGYSFAHPNIHSILWLTSGLLLAVKPPLAIRDWSFAPFTKNTFIGNFACKGVLQATLESPEGGGTRFALIGTHTEPLDTDNGIPKDPAQVEAHTAQAAQILSAVKTRSGYGTLPVLLLGDFNVGPGYADEAYRRIADAPGMRECGALLFPSNPIVTWDPENPLVKYGRYPGEPPAKIDHVFLRDGASLRWKAVDARRIFDAPVEGLNIIPASGAAPVPVPLSDHYGFMTDIEVNGSP